MRKRSLLKRMATNKHKRMATNKHKRTKAKHIRRHTQKRVRFSTRKMRGGDDSSIEQKKESEKDPRLNRYEEYPESFSKKDKSNQKKTIKEYETKIKKVCDKILEIYKKIGTYQNLHPYYRYTMEEAFKNKFKKYGILLAKVEEKEVDLRKKLKQNLPNNNKLLIDSVNKKYYYNNLYIKLEQCYNDYKNKKESEKKNSAGQVVGVGVGSLNPRPGSESTEYMNIDDNADVVNNSLENVRNDHIFRSNSSLARSENARAEIERAKIARANIIKNLGPLPQVESDHRTNEIAGIMRRSSRPAEIIVPEQEPVVENSDPMNNEPRRRILRRGKQTEVPVLPEYTDALNAIESLDRFLSIERKKMSE